MHIKSNHSKSISHTPYPPMRGAHTVTRAQSFVPSPLIHPRKALTPQIEIYALENSEVGGPQKVTFLYITVAVGLL